uniref:Potassium channel domain-containing protein n=1 Tax=Chrysotila carterae TaxID=13221 RepID=A0A7S4B0P3_CHRCT
MKFGDEENQQERNGEQPADNRSMPATRDAVKGKAAVADETIAKIASKKPPTHSHLVVRASLIALFALFFYILVGTVVYQKLAYDQGWTTIDATYFCLVTMSTVGYGDLVPLTTGNRAFTVVMIFVGIIFVFTTVSSAVGLIMRPISDAGRALMERLFPQRPIDINRNGQPDFMAPRHPVIFYSKNLLPSILLNTFIQLISAAVFLAFEEWDFGESFYHCLVTATTVGYGDITTRTQGGRLWACFHIMISVALLGELLSSVDELRQTRKRAVRKVRQLAAEISPDLLQNLRKHVPTLRRPDQENDGDMLTVACREHIRTESGFSVGLCSERMSTSCF